MGFLPLKLAMSSLLAVGIATTAWVTPKAEPIAIQNEEEIETQEELRAEGEKIYAKEFTEKLDDILGHEFKVKEKDGKE